MYFFPGDVPPREVRERFRILRIAEYDREMGFKSNLSEEEVKSAREFFESDEGSIYLRALEQAGLLQLALEIRRERFAKKLKESAP